MRPARSVLLTHILFAVLGAGTNYMVPVALFLQLPLMQQTLPEGVLLASRMNLAVNVVPICLSVVYVLYRSRPGMCRGEKAQPASGDGCYTRMYRLRRDAVVILLLLGNVAAASLAAAAWNVVIDGVSFFLYVACALAGMIGSFGAVVIIPWVSRYSAELIPAVNTGGAASMLVLALLDAAEGPGDAHPRFGASEFFSTCAGLCVAPLIAYVAIYCRQQPASSPPNARAVGRPVTTELSLASMRPDGAANISPSPAKPTRPNVDVMASGDGIGVIVLEDNATNAAKVAATSSLSSPSPPDETLSLGEEPRCSIWHFSALNFAVNFVCWGMQPSLIPLAVRHATVLGASEGPALQACTMASALCVTLGHAATTCFRTRRLNALTAVYMVLTTFFLLAAFDSSDGWRSTGGTVSVVLLVSTSRLLDGLFTSLLSLAICALLDGPARAKRKEHVLRVVGLAGSIGTLLGALFSAALLDAGMADASMNASVSEPDSATNTSSSR